MANTRIVHYINQFYAGIGGEEKANTPPEKRDGFAGPGMALNAALGDVAEIVGTVICGDSYFNENVESASAAVLDMIKSYGPEIVVVGPGFNAGRYGMACGMVAKLVDENWASPWWAASTSRTRAWRCTSATGISWRPATPPRPCARRSPPWPPS